LGYCRRVRTVEVKIEDIAFGGKGVARMEGKALFVPFTIEGERVSAKVTREKKQFAEGELVEVLEPSPERANPECPYFGRCGGCAYQHMNYDEQLKAKAKQVDQTMRRIGKLPAPPMVPIAPSALPYGYRNRITVHAEDNVIGFYRRDVHRLMDIAQCPIAMPEVNAALVRLRGGRVRDGHYTLRAHSGPRVFEQTNDAVADALAGYIAGMFAGDEKLLIDAFCGAGFFAKRFAPRFERVVGIDWDRFAIEAAQKEAGANEAYIAGDVAFELGRVLRGVAAGVSPADDCSDPRVETPADDCSDPRVETPATTLIVDPPATGLSTEIRQAILDSPPRTMFYVSCNPPTLARDLAELQSRFSIHSIKPFDMFPQTAEIEVVAELKRSESCA
ncbi:MAG: TRAM domain-containing protein, partial [Chthoniobacterales bacterium]